MTLLVGHVFALLALSTGESTMAKTPEEAGSGIGLSGCPANPPALPLVALHSEPPPRLIADDPVVSQLAEGRVVIRYRTENIRILPIFGNAAVGVSPRLGHLHITVDDGPWRWLDTSNQPIVVNKLSAGPHSILIELVDPNHRTVDKQRVSFVVPPPDVR